jgi:hypothetical protein
MAKRGRPRKNKENTVNTEINKKNTTASKTLIDKKNITTSKTSRINEKKILTIISEAEEVMSYDDIAKKISINTKKFVDYLTEHPDFYSKVLAKRESIKMIVHSRVEKALFEIAQGKEEKKVDKVRLMAIDMILKKFKFDNLTEYSEWDI